MKAVIRRNYGPPGVLEFVDVPTPTPADDEVRVKVRAASLNPLDWHMMRGTPYPFRMMTGLTAPKDTRMGVDLAGEVDAVGSRVSQFKPGDAVFGSAHGAFAEYACGPQSRLALKPSAVSFEQAASVPVAAITALQGLRDIGQIRPGHKVLINGASGGVGTFGVQIAKLFDAQVTGVCSTKNLEMVRALGADRVIDYTTEDFTSGTERYDVLLDCVGNHSVPARRRVLTPGGICAVVGAPKETSAILAQLLAGFVLSRFGGPKVVSFVAKVHTDDLNVVGEMMKAGRLEPVIDKLYPLADIAEAIGYLEQGHVRGKVVITIR